MKKRTLALLLAMVMVLTVALAGCGNNPAPASSVPAESSSAVEESSTPAESTPAESSEAAEPAPTGETTEVGTPRNETLIVEVQSPWDNPGVFNTWNSASSPGFGIHQLMSALMWEMDTVSGEQFGEVAADMGTPNADFTEWDVPIRQGIKWSDGEDLTAEDVAFTFNMVMSDANFGQNAYYNTVFESVEATDDYTVHFKMKESFPRLAQRFGVTIWGNDMRIVPEHIYSQQADVTTFRDEDPVVAGPYTVKEYDPLGNYVLYQLRDDWTESAMGVAGAERYGYTASNTPPKYVWFRVLGDDTTRQMMAINNEVDVMVEVTPEQLTTMHDANDKISAWYDDFPYATSDDPCSKGLVFSMGKGAPYDDPNFRWGMTLLLDIDQISLNVFDGVGRLSPFPILTATTAMQELYFLPMLDWVKDFELDLGNGEMYKPFDDQYKYRMAETLRARGYDIPEDDDALTDMFGIGWWKHDPEAAEKLLNKAGLTKENGVWMYNGAPFTFNMNYLANTEQQAGRGVQAAFNQWQAEGFQCTISSESSATFDTNSGTGNFDIGGYWPNGGITKDIYSQISGYDADLIVPMGEQGSGQGTRWNNAEATEIIHQLAKVDPNSDEAYQLAQDFVKIAVADMVDITFHSGIKFVPTNSTYWTNYPNAENPYNGPWWWWSCFKYILPNIKPVA